MIECGNNTRKGMMLLSQDSRYLYVHCRIQSARHTGIYSEPNVPCKHIILSSTCNAFKIAIVLVGALTDCSVIFRFAGCSGR